jgi:DNA-binding NtrC family response regulator
MSHDWPGNLRELSHELERGLIFSDGRALDLGSKGTQKSDAPISFPDQLRNAAWQLPEAGFDLQLALKSLESEIIEEAIETMNGNLSAAARRLGVPRDYLRYRVDR